MPVINPPQSGGSTPTQPTMTPGLNGLSPAIQTLTTGLAGNKAASAVSIGTTTAAIERLDLTFAAALTKVFAFDLFVGGVKKITDFPLVTASNQYPRRSFNIHIPSGSDVSYNAACISNTQFISTLGVGYTSNVAEPVTIIEPIAPVGSGATYPSMTGTLVKVPNGTTSSGWTCLNPAGATTNAYKYLYPFVYGYNDFTGRTVANGILELGYADDAAGTTNFVNIGVQYLIGQVAVFIYTTSLSEIPVNIPTGKYLFARMTLSVNANKTTGTVTDGDPFNVQIHGGR